MKTAIKITAALAAITCAFLASSCADYPVTLSVQAEQGSVGYSAKRGIEIEIDATK